MSDNEEKRFAATPARKERARKEGNAARSAEVSGLAAFVLATLAACVAVPAASGAAIAAFVDLAAHPERPRLPAALGSLALAALMPAVAAACGGGAAAFAQGGLHVGGLRADPKRLDPVAGIKRMCGGEALVAALRASVALVVVAATIAPVALDALAASAMTASPRVVAALVAGTAVRGCLVVAAVGAVFAVADYALARRRWLRSLRMSFAEIKRDAKENDGDPQARARRKAAHRAIIRGSIEQVRDASFVVVNPTHVAVALRYAPPAVPVPEILVRALDDAALRVRAFADAHGIPIVEDVALARLLHAAGENGRAIPPETYVAVAQVIAELARAELLA